MPANYPLGLPLEVRGEHWTLTREQRFDSCTLLTLSGAGAANAAQTLRVIEPFDRPRPIVRQKLRRRPRRAVLRAALGAIASARTPRGLWSAATAAIDVLPYQLEPALAVIDGAARLLLADAVGLGKTIQAGLIVSELQTRGWITRTLIVCPCGLRDTWAAELRERFGLEAAIVDQPALAGRIAKLPPGVNPWSTHSIVITSIDLLKRPEVLAAVDRVPIDLLIADEAHHLTPGTDRGAAVSRLAGRVPWVVLLSATPHSGDAQAFSYLTAIGRQDDPLTVFRRTRHDASHSTRRRTHLLPIHPHGDEEAVFAAVDRYVRSIWHGRGMTDRAVRLVAITLARRAASSVEALTHSLHRRLALLSGDAVREPEQGLLPWDESDQSDEIEGDGVLAAKGLDDPEAERQSLEHLLALAHRCERSSKIARVLRILRATREPVLIFTEYRDTLQAIASQLDGSRCSVIHGGLPADVRRDATARFNAGRADVMLATDAASEGLNLHHRCRLVLDIELPWNPLRLEQRFGRVDRIGQRRTVHAIRLFHPGTIEARVLEHLRIRRRRAEDAMEICANEQQVAEAMFDNRQIPAGPAFPRNQVMASAAGEADRISWQRRARAAGATQAANCWTSPKGGPLLAVHRTTFVNDLGLPVSDCIEARVIELSATPLHRRQWRQLVERLANVSSATGEPAPLREGLARRIAAIRGMVAHRSLVEYQRSLFDGRAEAEADDRARTAAQLDAALDRALRASTAGGVRADCELVAAWPAKPR